MAIELQDKLYTSAQVADVLGVSLRTLYRYMEDGKIESMKTASGRHRFTKEQILTFLDGGGLELEQEMEPARPKPSYDRSFDSKPVSRAPAPVAREEDYSFNRSGPASRFDSSFGSAQSFNSPKKQDAFSEANFDDFDSEMDSGFDEEDDFSFDLRPEKSRGDGNRFGERAPEKVEPSYSQPSRYESRFDSLDAPRPTAPKPGFGGGVVSNKSPFGESPYPSRDQQVKRPVENVSARGYQSQSGFASRPVQAPSRDFGSSRTPAVEAKNPGAGEGLNIRYYKSDYNDLIDLAKRVKEASISKDLEYAFTLNAGLSLHFLIDPFTLLHFYVNPEDLQVWRSILGLVPVSSKSEANVGILVNTDVVFIPTKEIGGFKVVEDKILLRDLMKASEDGLVKEFRQRILSA